MQLRDVSNEEYSKIVTNPFCRFNKAEFYALNQKKVDNVHYLIFNDGKDRFSLVLGVKNNVAKAPFSASFECFSEITKNNKISHYHDAITTLLEWLKEQGISEIVIATPPVYYNVSHITKMENALFVAGFKLKHLDVNFEYYLDEFDNYKEKLNYKIRNQLTKAEKTNLSFEKTDDTKTVYQIIKQNKEEKGYPLWMSYQDVLDTASIIPSNFFLVKDDLGTPVASALIHQITDNILRVVYWGNTQASNPLCPMNFLSYNLFKHYSTTPFRIIDIGISTEESVPNYGLCNFKENIGCKCSPKKIWHYKL